jgi:hypothetical protein
MPLFFIYIIFNNHSHNTIIHSFILHLSPRPHRFFAQQGDPPWDAEPRIELGPALQQADALSTELRRTLLSYAAPLYYN